MQYSVSTLARRCPMFLQARSSEANGTCAKAAPATLKAKSPAMSRAIVIFTMLEPKRTAVSTLTFLADLLDQEINDLREVLERTAGHFRRALVFAADHH